MKYTLILVNFVVLLFSCQANDVTKVETITINPLEQDVNFASVIEAVSFIPLENSEQALIGSLNNLVFSEGDVYVSQYGNNELIKIFDTQNGVYKGSVGSIGRGKGEATDYGVFTVTDKDVVTCAWYPNRKINYYNNQNQFLKDKDVAYPFDNLIAVDSNTWLVYVGNGTFSDEDNYSLLLVDQDFNIKQRLFEKSESRDKHGMGETTRFFRNDNQIYFRDEYNDTIYNIKKDRIIPSYKLNFGKYWPSDAFLKEYSEKDVFAFFGAYKENYAQFVQFALSDQYVIVSYFLQTEKMGGKSGVFCAIYNIKDKVTLNFSATENPLTYLFRNIFYADKNDLIGLIDVNQFLELQNAVAANKIAVSKELKIAIDGLSRRVSESDNHILVKIRLK